MDTCDIVDRPDERVRSRGIGLFTHSPKSWLSDALTRVRASLPGPIWARLEVIANRSRVERFLRSLDPPELRSVADREAVYAEIVSAAAGQGVTYLEFGVHEGKSLRYFIEALPRPDNRFHAFDSFEGLPEDWNDANRRGTFATGGTPPAIDDPRVEIHIGWFADTLAAFEAPRHGRLVVNVDCDLYSSTVTVLDWLVPRLEPGDLVYFDEFADLDHEFRAFVERLATTSLGVRPIVRSLTWNNVVFEVTAPVQSGRSVTARP